MSYNGSDTEITLPDSVDGNNTYAIYQYAFRYNNNITSVTISNGVTAIGDYAFYYCTSLQRVDYTGTIDQWVEIEFDNYSSNPLYYAKHLYINDKEVTEVNITTATKINAYAFYACKSITKVTIGNSVESIGEDAFYKCTSLQNVTIGNSVKSIGYRAFYYCTSLQSVTIGDSVESIGGRAFEYCYLVETVYYKGTSSEWSAISIGSSYNTSLIDATRYYYSETEPALNTEGTAYDGNYWHYDTDGITPVIWTKES